MPKFKVTKCVDAYAHHFTIVEADTADQAVVFAKKNENQLHWEEGDFSLYDDVSWDNIEPELIEGEEDEDV